MYQSAPKYIYVHSFHTCLTLVPCAIGATGHLVLDYKSMVAHKFIVDNEDRMLLYKLRFNKKHFEIIILHAPLLFDLLAENFLVTPKAVNNHRAQTFTPEPEREPEPELDPYRADRKSVV